MSTLILGTAFGYEEASVRPFVESLRRHYEGEVQLLITSVKSQGLVDYLGKQGIKTRLFDCAWWMRTHIQLGRYVRYWEILRESAVRYDRVLLTDVVDVFFQGDPFAGAPAGELLFFMEDFRATIGSCAINSGWIQQIFGPQIAAQLAAHRISCSGTTMGSHAAVEEYLSAMMKHVHPARLAALEPWRGHDQGIHNFLLHTGALPEARMVENGQWVHTLEKVPCEELNLHATGLYTAEGRRCPIVHQWNRYPEIAAWVQAAF